MSHEMLTLQGNLLNGHEAICVWAVIENWSVDEESGHNELLYANQEDAVRAFQSQLAVEANEGCIYRWKDREDFQFERNPLSYKSLKWRRLLCAEPSERPSCWKAKP